MDLCTLAQVKQYLGITASGSDGILQSLIDAYSRKVAKYCSRNFDPTTQTETRNGNGQNRMMLRQWPVTAIVNVVIRSQSVPPAAPSNGSGYFNVDASEPGDGRLLVMRHRTFDRGYSNVQVTYTSGYAPIPVTDELWNVPSTATITVLQALGYVGGDSVSYTGGAPLERVAGNPNQGQYSITSAGVLTFNPADIGAAVTIDYNTLGYPMDLTEAVVELVALRYKSRDWTGFKSKTLAGETVAFDTSDMPPTIKGTIDNYRVTMIPQ